MDRDPILYDDTYTGPRWTYGLVFRPLSSGAQPRGSIVHSLHPHPEYAFGTIDYPRELTTEELADYELFPVEASA